MKKYCILFLFLIHSIVSAQEPYSIHYTTNDGLPSNNIYSAYQDKEGYLWFTTDVGIVKYNSKNFELYNTDNGLSDNEVFKIKEDSKSRKWLLTLNGTPTFIHNNIIYNENNSSLINKMKGNSMLIDIHENEKGVICLANKKEDITILKDGRLLKTTLKNTTIYGVWEDGNDFFALTSQGIFNITKNKSVKDIKSKNSFRVYHNTKNNSYYSDKNSLYQIEKGYNIKPFIEIKEDVEIINLFIESKTKAWVCTRKGLYLFENDTLSNIYFTESIVSDIIKDSENNYWVTTLNKGLFFVPSFNVKQVKIKINCISKKSKDEIWFGGLQNDFYIKKEGHFIKNKIENILREDNISSIRFFKNEAYVIGKSGILKIKNNIRETFKVGINDILFNKGRTFIASSFTYKINTKNEANTFFLKNGTKTSKSRSSKIVLNKRTNVLVNGENDDVWIGTNFGLYKYNSIDSILPYSKHSKSIEGTSIEDLFYDKETNNLIVATASKGLTILNNDSVIHSISQKDGLFNNTINSIEKLEANTYLIGSNKGLDLLDINTNKVLVKNISSLGFKNKMINDITFNNDTIYLATNNELIYFNKQYLNNKTAKPKCIINSIYTGNQPITNKDEIDYLNNDIQIKFTGISFIDRGNLTYYYKINDDNQNWSSTKETQINYESLNPKTYTFSVYCINNKGQKSDIETLTFRIFAPFWQKLWFRIGLILVLSYFIYYLIARRVKQINKRFESEKKNIQNERDKANLEKQMVHLEQKALRLQMNPHFIFNALNTIKGYYEEDNVIDASSYISKFSKLLRLLLENTEQVIPLALEIKMLKLYIELACIRYDNSFQYKIFVDSNLNTEEISIPTLLLQPMVENAIIHGLAPKKEKGQLDISFKKNNKMLVCTVQDNGIGINASEKKKKHKTHLSKALDITKERLKLIEDQNNVKTSLKITDLEDIGIETGTKVTIVLPYIKIW